jgi:signal transduction histidine kinase
MISAHEADGLFAGSSGSGEQDPALRSTLAGLLRTGLRQCGTIGLVGTLLYVGLSVWGLGYELHWTYRAFQEGGRGSQVVMIALLIVAALSMIGLVLAEMDCSLRAGRLFGVGAVLFIAAVVAFEGALRDAFSTEYVALAFLLVVAIIPFRPAQVLGIGAGIGLLIYLLGPEGVVWEGPGVPSGSMARHLAFIGGASVLIAGAGAALYRRHRAFAQSQVELQKSRDLLRRTQKVGQVGGWEYFPGADRLRGTDWLWAFLGGPSGETIGLEKWVGLLATEARQKVREAVRRCVETGESFDLEVPVETAAAGQKWGRIRGEVRREKPREGKSRQGEGQADRVSGTLQDITRQKERKRALRKAKEEAERANRLKSAFLANVSHEIRTPLTSILGFAEAIGSKVGTPRPEDGPEAGEAVGSEDLRAVLRFARLIEQSGNRLMETLDAVLNLSKLEAGEMDLSIERVDLASRAEEGAEQFRRQAEEKNLDLQVRTETRVWARADGGALQIVLDNLLSNALKYTEEDGTVWIRAYQEEEGAAIEVEDTGIGMEPGRAEGLFEPFRQASEGLSREYEGTGLGLAVTKKAVDQMNGSIEVDTEKGEGSRFTVRLPKRPPAADG